MALNEDWNMIGHTWAVELLKKHLANGRIRHAYLFTGPPGVGRRTLALRLAQAINCAESQVPGIPCGDCRACLLTPRMEHPDLTIVQSEGETANLKVDQIREAQHSLSLTPFEAEYRIALFLRFEEANPNASNALLKTLEEPAAKVVMMLTAQDPESLLPTIVSRCEMIRLRPVNLEEVSEGLQTRFQIPAEKARLLAHISDGRPGYALQIHQDPVILEQRQIRLEDLQRLLSANRVARFAYIETLGQERKTIGNLLRVWSSFWRDVLLVALGSSDSLTNIDWEAEIRTLGRGLSVSEALKMINSIERTLILLNQNVNTRLALEVLMLDLPSIKTGMNIKKGV